MTAILVKWIHFGVQIEIFTAIETGMQMKSRNVHPPGGWKFFQAETGWSAPEWLSFDAVVSAVIQHRRANAKRFPQLSLDVSRVELEVDSYNAARMRAMKGGDAYIHGGEGPPVGFPTPHLWRQAVGQSVAAGVKRVKNTIAGIGLWMEFFGEEPVVQSHAEDRALTCSRCPLNIHGDILQRFNKVAGEEILSIFAAMKERKMATTLDGKLGVCGACDCPMRAKVWAPIDVIVKHLRPEAKDRLWNMCWMRKEMAPTQST